MAVIRVCHPHSPVSELVQGRWRWMNGTSAHASLTFPWLSKAHRSELSFWACSAFPAILCCEGTWPDHYMPRLAIPNCLLPQRLFYFILFCFLQASQLGVYRAFVDNYEVAMETAEKCCQANAQFAEISEVISWYSDTRDIWIWLVPCNVTPVYSPSIFATLTSEGVMNSLSFSLCSYNNL